MFKQGNNLDLSSLFEFTSLAFSYSKLVFKLHGFEVSGMN